MHRRGLPKIAEQQGRRKFQSCRGHSVQVLAISCDSRRCVEHIDHDQAYDTMRIIERFFENLYTPEIKVGLPWDNHFGQ